MNPLIEQAEYRPRANGQPGFSFIEMLMVITVLAIVAVVAVPHIARSAPFEVQGAARSVVSDLLFAQNEAIGNQATRRVIFDLANNRYRLTDAANTTLQAQWLGGDYVVAFGAGSPFSQVQIDAVSFPNGTVSFDALGSPSQGGTIDLTAGNLKYRITVTAFTGRVTVEEVTGG